MRFKFQLGERIYNLGPRSFHWKLHVDVLCRLLNNFLLYKCKEAFEKVKVVNCTGQLCNIFVLHVYNLVVQKT